MNWTEFMWGRSRREKHIVGMLAKGYLRSEAAEAVGLIRPAVTQRMSRMHENWDTYQEGA